MTTNITPPADWVSWPRLKKDDEDAVVRVVRSGSLLKSRTEVSALEREWCELTNAPYTLGVDSCSHAIHAALVASNLGMGSRVAVAALGFVGTVHPIVQAGCTPVFVDVEPNTFNIDPQLLEEVEVDAIIAVHLHGLPCDMDRIMDIAGKKGIPVIEDACQAHGAKWRGKYVGTFGKYGCFSLNEVKNLPAGQGGLITATNESDFERVKAVCGYGVSDSKGMFSELGYAYGLTELSAAIARTQLKGLTQRNEHVDEKMKTFFGCLSECPKIHLPEVPDGALHTWHKVRIMLDCDPDQFVEMLNANGVPAEFWARYLLPDHGVYQMHGHSEFLDRGVARNVIKKSFILGSERYPLFAQSNGLLDKVADVLEQLITNYE